jgi:hypothetical protein
VVTLATPALTAAVSLPATCIQGTGVNIKGTFREHSRNIQDYIQGTI